MPFSGSVIKEKARMNYPCLGQQTSWHWTWSMGQCREFSSINLQLLTGAGWKPRIYFDKIVLCCLILLLHSTATEARFSYLLVLYMDKGSAIWEQEKPGIAGGLESHPVHDTYCAWPGQDINLNHQFCLFVLKMNKFYFIKYVLKKCSYFYLSIGFYLFFAGSIQWIAFVPYPTPMQDYFQVIFHVE